MSRSIAFKCPSCGGYLEFDPGDQRFECRYCGHAITEEMLQELSRQHELEAQKAHADAAAEGLKSYHCQMCGAEIVTGATTAATRCYYCHQPVVLADRLSEEFRPDGVIPFSLDRQAAEAAFHKYVDKKLFIDKSFFSQAQLEDFSGVYYPYWYGEIEGDADFEGEGRRVSVVSGPREVITTTRIFKVIRKGRLCFRNMVRKALSSTDRKLSDGIHPYRLADMKPFATGYLSGFLAERRDVEEDAARQEMLQEASSYAEALMQRDHTFDTLSGDASFHPDRTALQSVLLPTWVLTYKGGRSSYFYMMNGQTGSVCGKLPINQKKLLLWSIGAGAAVFALLCLGGALLW